MPRKPSTLLSSENVVNDSKNAMEIEKEGGSVANQKMGVIRTTDELVKALHSSSVDVRIKIDLLHRIWHRTPSPASIPQSFPSSVSIHSDIAGVLLPNRNRTILEWTINLVIRIFTSTTPPSATSSLVSLTIEGYLESLWLFLNEVLRSPLISPSTTISNPHHLQNAIQNATLMAWKEANNRLTTSQKKSSFDAMEVEGSSRMAFLRLAEAIQTTFETLHRKFSSSTHPSSSSSSLSFLSSSSFRTSVDQSVGFLSVLTATIVGDLPHLLTRSTVPEEVIRLRSSVMQTLSLALHRCNVSLQQQANPRKVFGLIVTRLLENFIVLRSKLLDLKENIDGVLQGDELQLVDTIVLTLQDLLSSNLFHSSTIYDYAMAFTNYKPASSTEKKEIASGEKDKIQRGQKRGRQGDDQPDGSESSSLHSYQQTLFATLRKLVQHNPSQEDTETGNRVMRFLPWLYSAFITALDKEARKKKSVGVLKRSDESSDQHLSLDFDFFVELYSLLNPKLSTSLRKQTTPNFNLLSLSFSGSGEALHSLTKLLGLIESHNIYSASDDPKQERFQYFAELATTCFELIGVASNSVTTGSKEAALSLIDHSCYCLKSLLRINHLSVASHVSSYWSMLWRINLPWTKVPNACKLLTQQFIETYSKLRQTEEFLGAMYPPISQVTSGSKALEFFLDPSFVQPWSVTVQQMPLMQIPFVWESLLNEIKDKFQPLLEAGASYNLTKGKKEALRGGLYKSLEPLNCLLTLFGKFLDNILVNIGNKQMVKKLLESTLIGIVKPLLQPLLGQLSPSVQAGWSADMKDLLRTGVLFYHSLIDLWMFLLAMPTTRGDDDTKEREEAIAGIESYFQLVDSSESTISLLMWSKTSRTTDSSLLLVLAIVSLQRVHQLQALISLGRSSSERYRMEMSQIATLLFEELARCFSRIQDNSSLRTLSWNGSLLSVSTETLPIALWQVIANNIQVLCSVASESHRKLFLELLLAKQTSDLLPVSSLSSSTITLASVNLSLIQNSNFYELHPLRAHVMSVLLERVLSSLSSPSNAIDILQQQVQVNTRLEQMNVLHDRLFRISGKDQSGLFAPGVIETVSTAFKLITAFPPQYFTSNDVARCAVVVLGVEKLLSHVNPSRTSSELLKLLLVCRIVFKHLYQHRYDAIDAVIPCGVVCSTLVGTPILVRRIGGKQKESWLVNDVNTETIRLLYVISSALLERNEPSARTYLTTLGNTVLEGLGSNKSNNSEVSEDAPFYIQLISSISKATISHYSQVEDACRNTLLKKTGGNQSFVVSNQDIDFFSSLDKVLYTALKAHLESKEEVPSLKMLPYYEAVALLLHFQRLLASEFLDSSKTTSPSSKSSLEFFGKVVSISTSQLVASEHGDAAMFPPQQMLDCLEALCRSYRSFQPPLSADAFCSFLALLHYLIASYGQRQKSQLLEKSLSIYRVFVYNSNRDQLVTVIQSIRNELASPYPHRIRAAILCCSKVFSSVKSKSRVEVLNRYLLEIVLKLVSIVGGNAERQDSGYQAERRQRSEVTLSAVNLITYIAAQADLFSLGTKDVSCILQCISPFIPHSVGGPQEVKNASLQSSQRRENKVPILSQELFLGFYHMLLNCLKFRPNQTKKCMASLISNIRCLLASLVAQDSLLGTIENNKNNKSVNSGEGGSDGDGEDKEEEEKRTLHHSCAQNLARLYTELGQHKKQFQKYVVYSLADYICITQRQSLSTTAKQELLPGIYSLLDICTEHEFQQLYRVLDHPSKSTFKTLYSDYTRDHKYTGKV